MTMKMKMKRVTDLSSKDCSGCALCASVCPKGSIKMVGDSLGFLRPQIDESTCIDCGLCAKKCIFVIPEVTKMPIETYAAVRNDKNKIIRSSSGGIFASIAEKLLSEGWYVVGCMMTDDLSPCHIIVSDEISLQSLYGSKYVQSSTEGIYRRVGELLKTGKRVLFSGTPCQVAAVKRFTNADKNLVTIEVICHGVPNNEMFQSSLEQYGRRMISSFVFRDKRQGWTFNNLISYKNGKSKRVNHRLSSYMTYFLEGEIYRESCYECPYAKPERGADITIGDFWGIVERRNDLKQKIDIENGVSCLIVNSLRGKALVESCEIDKYKVAYEDIMEGNVPLNHPSRHTDKREIIMSKWGKNKNWQDVHNYWNLHDFKISYLIWSRIPIRLQHRIRLLLGKR